MKISPQLFALKTNVQTIDNSDKFAACNPPQYPLFPPSVVHLVVHMVRVGTDLKCHLTFLDPDEDSVSSPLCSGVVEYLSTGGVDCTHKDFKELRYSDSLTKFNCNGKNSTSNGRITHGFKLKSAYENGLMPYTNYTFDFKVIS